jgi:hypothetical protein
MKKSDSRKQITPRMNQKDLFADDRSRRSTIPTKAQTNYMSHTTSSHNKINATVVKAEVNLS